MNGSRFASGRPTEDVTGLVLDRATRFSKFTHAWSGTGPVNESQVWSSLKKRLLLKCSPSSMRRLCAVSSSD